MPIYNCNIAMQRSPSQLNLLMQHNETIVQVLDWNSVLGFYINDNLQHLYQTFLHSAYIMTYKWACHSINLAKVSPFLTTSKVADVELQKDVANFLKKLVFFTNLWFAVQSTIYGSFLSLLACLLNSSLDSFLSVTTDWQCVSSGQIKRGCTILSHVLGKICQIFFFFSKHTHTKMINY